MKRNYGAEMLGIISMLVIITYHFANPGLVNTAFMHFDSVWNSRCN